MFHLLDFFLQLSFRHHHRLNLLAANQLLWCKSHSFIAGRSWAQKMDQKTNRRRKVTSFLIPWGKSHQSRYLSLTLAFHPLQSPFGRISSTRGRNSTSRHGVEASINTTGRFLSSEHNISLFGEAKSPCLSLRDVESSSLTLMLRGMVIMKSSPLVKTKNYPKY